ncbi:hypothetical protein AKJ09_06159 [Labilithrix luteola]|uniref:Uncharacterized protein n=1 Tax=Labilithrix luteola TaxID=1391654 RepID=A0A0K1Q131_9BACT|nr:hypothetical protein [Labilithrix luteola]AKU99495.1 hypothetical protein AKJ09_06159 [Labilithrix luteola]
MVSTGADSTSSISPFGAVEAPIEVGAFYASDGDGPERTKLTTVLDAIDAAIGRGVRVRLLADAGFAVTYPTTLARLEKSGAEVRKELR